MLDAGFTRQFASTPTAYFSAPGRTEIGGNHTDHQHGRVLCGSVDLDMLACAALNDKDVIRIVSEGYPPLEIGLDSLLPREEERNTSAAIVRGIAAWFAQQSLQLYDMLQTYNDGRMEQITLTEENEAFIQRMQAIA